ncbi:unnamed protein product [Vitrella brassicaformis CCMP3155]|uniref:Uncharacterized protein n=1 Tax=Vitrella brassicaformis (strain CCMP3155) TaxID=1169540 RepID=A0A0G4EMR4_VITBC|nr:unnamed protein product [Vitrella brassicaformis CCMP3155]|eukprot:CEL98104.1 unnamed protein product [Vitrella brassicaformis CCMP3155]
MHVRTMATGTSLRLPRAHEAIALTQDGRHGACLLSRKKQRTAEAADSRDVLLLDFQSAERSVAYRRFVAEVDGADGMGSIDMSRGCQLACCTASLHSTHMHVYDPGQGGKEPTFRGSAARNVIHPGTPSQPSCEWCPRVPALLCGSSPADGAICIWDVRRPARWRDEGVDASVCSPTVVLGNRPIMSAGTIPQHATTLRWCPDEFHLLAQASFNMIHVLDIRSPRAPVRCLAAPFPIQGIEWTGSGSLVTCGWRRDAPATVIQRWGTADSTCATLVETALTKPLMCADKHPDHHGCLLVCGISEEPASSGKAVPVARAYVIDPRTHEMHHPFGQTNLPLEATRMCVSAGRVMVACGDETVATWHMEATRSDGVAAADGQRGKDEVRREANRSAELRGLLQRLQSLVASMEEHTADAAVVPSAERVDDDGACLRVFDQALQQSLVYELCPSLDAGSGSFAIHADMWPPLYGAQYAKLLELVPSTVHVDDLTQEWVESSLRTLRAASAACPSDSAHTASTRSPRARPMAASLPTGSTTDMPPNKRPPGARTTGVSWGMGRMFVFGLKDTRSSAVHIYEMRIEQLLLGWKCCPPGASHREAVTATIHNLRTASDGGLYVAADLFAACAAVLRAAKKPGRHFSGPLRGLFLTVDTRVQESLLAVVLLAICLNNAGWGRSVFRDDGVCGVVRYALVVVMAWLRRAQTTEAQAVVHLLQTADRG